MEVLRKGIDSEKCKSVIDKIDWIERLEKKEKAVEQNGTVPYILASSTFFSLTKSTKWYSLEVIINGLWTSFKKKEEVFL